MGRVQTPCCANLSWAAGGPRGLSLERLGLSQTPSAPSLEAAFPVCSAMAISLLWPRRECLTSKQRCSGPLCGHQGPALSCYGPRVTPWATLPGREHGGGAVVRSGACWGCRVIQSTLTPRTHTEIRKVARHSSNLRGPWSRGTGVFQTAPI